jgi:AAA15 family ATPase/GTPase
MLLEFSCKNYRSFREKQTLSMLAGGTGSKSTDERLIGTDFEGISGLRCACIYGANASGKSNLLKAIQQFSRMIADSQKRWDSSDKIPGWDPFSLDQLSRTQETEFEAEVLIERSRFRYGFSFNGELITREWLYEYAPRERTLFFRQTEGTSVYVDFTGRNLTGTTLETIKQVTRPNSLFLSAAAQNNYERLAVVQRWFAERFSLISGQECDQMLPFTANRCNRPRIKEAIRKLIGFADIGIDDFEVIEEEAPEKFKKFYDVVIRALSETNPDVVQAISAREPFTRTDVRMMHRGLDGHLYPLAHRQQSRGTLAYFGILGPMMEELKDGSILLIDELDSSLHPHLVQQFVHIFNSPRLNPFGAQFIFTTHDTNLMSSGMLRRDQFWFTEKDVEGTSKLYPLSDFKPRKDQNLELGYLHGRFGAIPFLDTDLLDSVLHEDEADETIAIGEGAPNGGQKNA